MLYQGRFAEAQHHFADLAARFPAEPAGPALEAGALIWWAEAREDDAWQQDSVDHLLGEAVSRAQAGVDHAADTAQRATALFWLGTAYGYRARQADLHGSHFRAARDAKAMRGALTAALALDSTRVDCELGLGLYEYALARASALARFVARIIGLGSGNVGSALARLQRVSRDGTLARTEARWVYANMMLRESQRDPALREPAQRLLADLAAAYPENPVFQRAVRQGAAP